MEKWIDVMSQFVKQYQPFETENRIDESTTRNGVTYYHGWYLNRPFVVSLDHSVDYMELQDGEFNDDEIEELFQWVGH